MSTQEVVTCCHSVYNTWYCNSCDVNNVLTHHNIRKEREKVEIWWLFSTFH